MRTTIAALVISGVTALAADCDIAINALTPQNVAVQYNNKTRACYNWQLSYFAAGFTALEITFESAPDAGGIPGTYTAFAGTTLTGSNPMTATDQATSTFAGAYAWVRVRITSSTGNGVATGRLLGAQATSAAIGFGPSGDGFPWFGDVSAVTVPASGAFTLVDNTTLALTDVVDSNGANYLRVRTNANPAAANNNRQKACVSVTPPFTLTVAWMDDLVTANQDGGPTGVLLRNSGTSAEELLSTQKTGTGSGLVPTWANGLYRCTGATPASCTATVVSFTESLGPIVWLQVYDDNAGSRGWRLSREGPSFANYVNNIQGLNLDPISGANYAAFTPDQACLYSRANNANLGVSFRVFHWDLQ